MKRFLLLIALLTLFKCAGKNEKIDIAPEWAKGAVWYQIFPDRFNNADKSNDPAAADLKGGWPYDIPDNWRIHPWTSDWYKLQSWEKKNGHDFYWNAGLRRYGGDIQGIIDKLDYLKNLGINSIYLNPVFESPSLHKYDTKMYHHIDDNFGPNPELDKKIIAGENPADPNTWQWTTADSLFLRLIEETHRRDMRIIIDGVFNHVGNTFWAFRDVVEKQQNSEFKDWFIIKSWDDKNTEENEFEYGGWFGVKDLPEIKENENGPVSGYRNHIKSIVKRWMDPNGDGNPADGIDGWRLDVADMVDIDFWKDFRGWVKEINKDAYLTGEVWWKDWEAKKMHNASKWLHGKAFDGVMNYRYAAAVKNFVIDDENKISADEFADRINKYIIDYSPVNYLTVQNLNSSHDVERLASQVVNPDVLYDHNGNPNQSRDFNVRKPDETEYAKMKFIAGIQMTLPGAPMIYYGDEAGMWGGDDPDCRKPMVWPEFNYETETAHPFGMDRPADEVNFNRDIFNWYQKMISIRKSNLALLKGDISFISMNDSGMLCYSRNYKTKNAVILLNNSDKSQNVYLDAETVQNHDMIKDQVSDDVFQLERNKFHINLAPYQIMIFNI